MKKFQSLGRSLDKAEQKKIMGGLQDTTCSYCRCADGRMLVIQHETVEPSGSVGNPGENASMCSSFCGPVPVVMQTPELPC